MSIRKDSDEYWDLIRDLDKRYEKRELRPGEPRHQPAPNTTRHGGGEGAWRDVLITVVVVMAFAAIVVGSIVIAAQALAG